MDIHQQQHFNVHYQHIFDNNNHRTDYSNKLDDRPDRPIPYSTQFYI